ncbi:MAG: hypothetical protein P1V51_24220 [Deltaproteobacteria bacterium]|nr:hypothetical protein [Deltaproteobacteria bacterium]
MRIPEALTSLIEQGIIEEVLRPLQSGKEATLFLVRAYGEEHVAKIYKAAAERSFKHRADYTEGRRTRSSRDQRAISKGSRYGRAKQEEAWRQVEADVIYRLRDAGVNVPEPKAYVDDVLIMELVTDRHGRPAPRLGELTFERKEARALYEGLVADAQKMLCAGLVHGDLSEFNVLAGRKGAVIIDFPQAVDASTNRNARKLLIRDLGNLSRFFGRFDRDLRGLRHAEELWEHYEQGELTPDTPLTGKWRPKKQEKVEVSGMLAEILELEAENRARREALGLPPARPARQPKFVLEEEPAPPPPSAPPPEGAKKNGRSRRRRRRGPRPGGEPRPEVKVVVKKAPASGEAAKRPRRRRRRRKPGAAPGGKAE